ncbi:cupin domain-containing protein [Winogradskyella arenosi]|uniref:Quercetin dioxygenase-like cupin family protein n=1 Tax=Winogradskyella arenosi TaxID=533325 RepID=A0A368ZHX5_9FLAO|nr:cupin domain-containing protein [Winogradskyella arenosi]RCW93351.1 quercetin dioxygenase-like cupin family protein [Winogradskyella arenosi]
MKSFGSSKEFLLDENQEWEVLGGGIKRKIMGYDDKIMLVKVHFEEGAIGYEHEHHHSQATYAIGGEWEFTIGGVTKTVKDGDSVYIPPHVLHGAKCTKAGILIDVFSPIREDFME